MRGHRRHVDLQHLDAVVLRALEEPRVGLNVGIMDDQKIGLFGDRGGQRLGAGICAPVRIADLERIAERGRLLTPDRRPGLGDVEAHRDRDEDHLLALDPAEIVAAADLIEAGIVGQRRRIGERRA